MRMITFTAKLFKHDSRFGFYIPKNVIDLHRLHAKDLNEGLQIIYSTDPPEFFTTDTTYAYDYPQKGTIRVFFSDFEGILLTGQIVQVTMNTSLSELSPPWTS